MFKRTLNVADEKLKISKVSLRLPHKKVIVIKVDLMLVTVVLVVEIFLMAVNITVIDINDIDDCCSNDAVNDKMWVN